MPFQSKVNILQAPGVVGDFASTNPFSSLTAGPGALVAPAGGLIVGNFAWVGPLGQVSQSFVSGWQIGFLGRNEQALITAFLGEFSLVVPEGFMVTLFNGGDFWAGFATGATAGAGVFADETTGAPQMQATNSGTGSQGFTGTATFLTATTVVTIVASTDGVIQIGDTITAVDIPTGTTVLSYGTYTQTAGTGTINTSAASTGTVSSAEALTAASTILNVTAIADGGFSVGDAISGSGVASGSVISAILTGSGGVGTYNVLVNGVGTQQNYAPATISGPANTSTGWTVGPLTLVGPGIAKITHSVS
jgi:hypothetical protein